MYLVAMVMTGAPVGTPGKGPLDPAMSMWEYGRGVLESTPCCIGLKKKKKTHLGTEKTHLGTEKTYLLYHKLF